jgi:7,8-dihydropterin-6-yl-methyl-4-(beta-D-ribofuranosyl)aminobenzene 5'-phosphate synthase
MCRRTIVPPLVAALVAGAAAAGEPAARFTILYDNSIAREGVQSAWGFACLVEAHGRTVLFDTGGDPAILKGNLAALAVNTAAIQAVVISHFHGDHTFGAPALAVPRGTPVYTPHSFAAHREAVAALTSGGMTLVPVTERKVLFEGFAITSPQSFGRAAGPVGRQPWEQALLVDTPRGPVMVVGCAHPGVVAMVEQAKREAGAPIHMVLGGFHLMDRTRAEARSVAVALQGLGVAHAGPTHCTGDEAIAAFREVYGDAFVAAGVGRVIEIPAAAAATS